MLLMKCGSSLLVYRPWKLARSDVVVGVDQPVRVEHDDGVHARLAAAATDLDMAVDGVLPRALARPVELAQVHRRHVGDLGGQRNTSHVQTPQCGMWCEPRLTHTFLGSRKTS
jgi:hypothetical protein